MGKLLKKNWLNIIIWLMLISGALLLLYPIYSNYLLSSSTKQQIKDYDKIAQETSEENKAAQLQMARQYNETLSGTALTDPFTSGDEGDSQYENTLSLIKENGISGVIGYINIPSISVDLPIYHGVSDKVLAVGAGHLPGSSFPIGGNGTHAVITGHTGLPNAKLFTDLTKLNIGDQFSITVYDEKMMYEIDDIRVVEPSDTSWFTISPDQDQVTLITCTPYGINSHRLVITGHRIPMEETKEVTPEIDWYNVIVIGGIVLGLLIFAIHQWRKKRQQKAKSDNHE